MSEFVLASSADAARQTAYEHSGIKLTRQTQVVFLQALLDPPSAVPRLQRAAAAYLGVIAWSAGRDDVH